MKLTILLLTTFLPPTVIAFSLQPPRPKATAGPSRLVLHSSSIPPGTGTPFYAQRASPPPGGDGGRPTPAMYNPTMSPAQLPVKAVIPAFQDLIFEGSFENVPAKRIQGGGTIVTYQMPPHADRAQMYFETEGRPLKAKVEVWVGPIRRIHNLDIDCHDGSKTPYMATIKFKKMQPVLKISTPSSLEFPLIAKVSVPSSQRSGEIDRVTNKVFNDSPRTRIQGGPVSGKGGGAIRTFVIPTEVESVQIIIWSTNTGKKSCRAKIEVFQGPNNAKQTYELQVSGGLQPYHAVYATPGEGATIRIQNLKFVEDGLFEVVVVPYKVGPPPNPEEDAIVSTNDWWSGQ
jgi:hypothetical protein